MTLEKKNAFERAANICKTMKGTSSTGWTHSCILDRVEGTAQNKLPQFRVLRGSKPADWLKMASTS